MSPWLAALCSWLLATGLIGGIYALWRFSQGKSVRWDLVGEAALFAIPLALFLAWRDRR